MLKSPRLLVLTELFLPTKGGTAVWFDAAYRRLGGKSIHIVTADVPGADDVDRDHPNTVHRVTLKRRPWLRPHSLAMYAQLFATGLATILRHPIDAVHAGRVLPEGLVGWVLARMSGKPLVIYAHGEEITTWRQAGKFKAMRFAYRHADRVIANSEFTRDELIKLDVDPARITLIFPGADTERFRPGLAADHLRASLGLTREHRLILSVGRLSRRKGFDRVIEALPKLLEQGIDVHYALIGIGEDHDYLTGLAEKTGVAGRVHLLGHVSVDDLPLWYNACDVFAMPNREIGGDTEGFGMVFLEAAACAKPCIAGRDGGTGSAVEDGVTGFRVNGHDSEDVVARLALLLNDETRREAFGRAGHARAVTDFSWDAVTRKTRTLIESL